MSARASAEPPARRDVDLDATFHAFRARTVTLGPTAGARESWHRGRTRYAVWVLRIDASEVLARMARIAAALADAIEPVAAADAHVTTFVAGFPCQDPPAHDDDVPWTVLDAQAAALASASLRPVEIEMGGANAFASCAFLDVKDPHRTLARVRDELARVHPEVRFAPYTPHVTIGRFRDVRPTAPIASALHPHRPLPPIRVTVRTLELVTFDAHRDGHATLLTERRVRLGGT
ncbi:MAG: 2'-5' RNA ligase family protein [bacterium]